MSSKGKTASKKGSKGLKGKETIKQGNKRKVGTSSVKAPPKKRTHIPKQRGIVLKTEEIGLLPSSAYRTLYSYLLNPELEKLRKAGYHDEVKLKKAKELELAKYPTEKDENDKPIKDPHRAKINEKYLEKINKLPYYEAKKDIHSTVSKDAAQLINKINEEFLCTLEENISAHLNKYDKETITRKMVETLLSTYPNSISNQLKEKADKITAAYLSKHG